MKLKKKQRAELLNKYYALTWIDNDKEAAVASLCKEYEISKQECYDIINKRIKVATLSYNSYRACRKRPKQLKCTGHRFVIKNKTVGEVKRAISDFSGIKKIRRNANGDVEIIYTGNHSFPKWYHDIEKLISKNVKISKQEFLRAKNIVENYDQCFSCGEVDQIKNLEKTVYYGYEKCWCKKCYAKVKDD